MAPQNPNACTQSGSIIQPSTQVVGETIPLVGVPFYLSHFSNRVTGKLNDYKLQFSLNQFSTSGRLALINANDESGANLNSGSLPTETLDLYTFDLTQTSVPLDSTWGAKKIIFDITIREPGAMTYDSILDQISFQDPVDTPMTKVGFVGNFKAKKLGLGGWTPSIWHFYDPLTKILYTGDGNTREVAAVTDGAYFRVASSSGDEVYYFDNLGRIAFTKTGLVGTKILTFGYNSFGYLSTITDAFNKITRFNYNATGKLTSLVSPEGVQTTFSLDVNGYLKTVTNPKAEVYKMTYQGTGGLLSRFEKPSGNFSTFTYDPGGNLTRDQNSSGFATDLAKDEGFFTSSTTSAMGLVTTNAYNPDSHIEEISIPARISTSTYTHTPTQDTAILPFDVITKNYTNDPRFGAQVKTLTSLQNADFGGSTTLFTSAVTLNNAANIFSINKLTKTAADGSGKWTSTYTGGTKTHLLTSPAGRKVTSKVDAFERPISEQVGMLNATTYTYTSDLLTKITQGVRTITLAYTSTKQVSSITNSLGQQVLLSYDTAQRLTSKTLPDGRVINFTYDSNSNLTSITPPSRPVHTEAYGSNELLQSYNPPTLPSVAAPSTAYTYNLDKQLTKIQRPDGKTINFEYDYLPVSATGLLQRISGDFGGFIYAHDKGRVSQIASERNLTIADFGYLGNTINSMQLSDNYVFSYYQRTPVPNTNGLIQSESLNTQNSPVNKVNYTYDGDKLLTKAGNLTLAYNPNGNLVSTTLNKIKEAYTYNAFGEVLTFKATFVDGTTTKNLYSYTLTYDNAGRVTKKVETFDLSAAEFISNYIYDAAGRLIQVTSNTRATANYNYDQNSNRISGNNGDSQSFTATYDAQDRLTNYNNSTYTYNANGDLTKKSTGGVNVNYSYDSLGNLESAGKVKYIFNALGKRAYKVLVDPNLGDVRKAYYLYSPEGRLLGETDPDGVSILKRYVYASKAHVPDYFVDQTNAVYKIITDHLGSVRLIVRVGNGQVMQRMKHDEFGRVLEDSKPGYTVFGFAGGLYDVETKLTRFGVRDYDAETGRWTNKDPIRFDGIDTNLYGYVTQDPINLIDPSGKVAIADDFVAAVILGGAISGVINAGATYYNGGTLREVGTSFGTGFVGGAVGAASAFTGTFIGGLASIPLGLGTTILTSTIEGENPAAIYQVIKENQKRINQANSCGNQ